VDYHRDVHQVMDEVKVLLVEIKDQQDENHMQLDQMESIFKEYIFSRIINLIKH
jgi:hypothetical protein